MWKRIARYLLRVCGWKAVGAVPDVPKAVVIAAPHTSNWDGFWALTYKIAVGIDIRFFAKHSLFWFPLGTLLSGLGGIRLDRTKAGSAVAIAVDKFRQEERFFFGLAPEGTRALRDGWKTGFYRIAKEANVPVFLGYIDYAKKEVGIKQRLDLTDDIEADLRKCADFYRAVTGRWPAKASPVKFAELERPTNAEN